MGERGSLRRRDRKVIWVASGISSAIAITGGCLLAAAPARASIAPGVGNSYAQSIQDTPKDGSLAVGAVLGEALAGHTNSVARAQSQGLDETAIGTSLQAYNCGTAPSASQLSLVAQPLQAETGEPGAAQGFTETPTTGASSESSSQLVPPTFGSTEFVQANAVPYGEADTSYASIAVPGAVFTVSGTYSKAWSGLVNGQREAGATEDIKSLDLLSGLVQLDGLHWEVIYPSGGSAAPSGSFTIGRMLVNGTPVPVGNPATALTAANAALEPFGLQLSVPTVTDQQGVESVGALEVDVVPNSTRDGVLDPAVTGLQPVTQQVDGGLENGFGPQEPSNVTQALCQSDTPITVADIAIASVDGAGSYVTSFGGVDATSGSAPVNPYNLSLPSFGLSPGSTQYVPGTPVVPGTPAVTGSNAAVEPGTTTGPGLSSAVSPLSGPATSPAVSSGASGGGSIASGGGSIQPTQSIAATGTSPGGPLLGIGLGGLAALFLLAEGDRRMMRRAQRGGGFEDFEE
jgi:hypothetical protein